MVFKSFKYQISLIICCIPSILGSCFYDGQFHEEGKPWNLSCDICNCLSNAVTCTKMACPAVSCKPGEVLMHTLNECCPECIPHKIFDKRRSIQPYSVQNFTATVQPQSTEFTSPSSSLNHETDIFIPQGQTVELGSHWLSTVGHKIPDDELEVYLNIAPRHGYLTLKNNVGFIDIEEEYGYSFASVIHETYYNHDGSNNFKDFAVFKIMGGLYTSLHKVNFFISPNDRDSPVILDSTSLFGTVIEGKYLDLRRGHLAYTDWVSGDHEIVFSLREEPKFGTLNKLINGNYYPMKIRDTFTQEDINTQMIRYVANDGIGYHAQKDFLSFDVSDGSGNVQPEQVLTMKVKPKKRSPPVIRVASDVKVNEGGEAVLEPHIITVSDPDSPLSDLIAYIEKQPDYGFLENSRPIPETEHSLAGVPISSFSYTDLVEGYIKYQQIEHRDMEPERDTLYIRVSDGYLSSPSHLVNITIKPINDEPPVVHTHHLSVLQGGFVKISNSTLSVSDGDTSADQLIITLDNPPQKGEIRLMTCNTYNFKNSKPLLKQDTFTFQDVLNGLIMYVHGDSKSHDNDTFSLNVSDGHHVISASTDVFVIVKDREVPYLVRNLGLEIIPGNSITIDNKTPNTNDYDSSAHLLRYVFISDPSSGDLFIIHSGKENKLSSHFKNSGMNAFMEDDADKEIIVYSHKVDDPIGLHYFKFNVIDPANNTLLDLKFFISISGSCFYDGQVHEEGKPWNSSCDICNCHSNAVTCTKMACPAVSCKPGEVLTHTLNECCPQCIPYKRPCDVDSTKYEHNDVWQSNSKCIFYQCHDGFSIPFLIQCPSLVCSKDERLFTSPGKCCPKCVPLKCDDQNKDGDYGSVSSSGCLQNISYNQNCEHNADIKKQPTNLFWQNPCTFCVTENGEVDCYSQKCPACSSQLPDNNLCCSCTQESCAEDCLKCSDNDTSFCTYCKDSSKVIHNGKCQADCPKSYFKNENMICESCPQTCKTCFGNMSSQCSSCKSGYLLQKGHCVKSCGINFYEFDGYCLECHESCSSCIGPSDEDCIGCSLSGQLLQNGKCVDDCDGHFYVADGYCLACNESCIRCLKNGSCQYCEEGFYLQDGLCLPDCLPGFYTFLNAYCMPCHEECQECFGPLPYQCITCPFNQYLIQNSCVSDCGQGYFGDLGAGVCRPCHPDCRACLGGSSNDKCLTCSSGYLLPYIGTHFGSCVEKCPDEYYLMESGVCGTCFETCHTCFGPNDTECITCNSTFFFKNGACVPHCSTGYFEDGGICYACHPSCATCYGFGESECVTCPPGRKFKYGQCVSACEEGKYMSSDNTCIDCHPSCIDCMLSSSENKTVQCIKCQNQQFSILKDECIPECSSDLYLNSYHICTECHPSCATCERTGATSCASCLDGSFLTHKGTCESQCHLGYFPANGICEPCNSDCHECISLSKCLKCKGDLVLQYGKCVTACTEEFYLDTVTRQCKGCSPECKSCRGPLLSDCLSCVPGKLFEDGVCVDHCSDGFFQDGNLCKTCDLKCRTCSDLNKCTSCDYPLLFLKNECVDDCGGGFYSDFETLTCEVCSIGCASCISSDHCTLCYSGFYLMNFECVIQCPSEYYGDDTWRICKKNIDVPALHANSILKFPPGRKILISASFLSASDADSNFLFITISQQPDNGFLLKMSEKGNEIKLNPGENFTSSELKDGWVFFKHLQGIPLNGEVLLRVSDGRFSSNEIILPLSVSSTFPPVIEHMKDIVLTENSLIVLNSSFFSINDPDNSKDVVLQVIEGPCSGKLVLLPEEKEVLSFSYEEFLQNRFALKSFQKPLKHDDKFILQISDGFNSVIAEIQVFVLPEEQKQLFLMRNNTFLVKYEELSKLTNDYLLVMGENLSPADIVFSFEKSSVIPFGNFFKNVINSKKKKKISSGKISFTQEDLNQGLISYKHLDNTTTNFVINMKATSAKSKVVVNFDFEIQVLTYDDALVISEETNQFGMMVLQNHPATITNDHLQIPLNGISAENIVYMITKKLTKDEGFLESLDKPGYRLQSFTQKAIDNLKIVYHPPPYSEGSEVNYMFQFVVLDKRRNIQLSPVQNFTITVRAQSTEITSPSSSIDHETDIVIPQGQTVELGSHWLSTVGHEIPEDQLEVVLNIAPQHGNLTLKLNNGFIDIEEEDGYSFTSVIHDTYYTHDGSNIFKDFAVFKIMGGQYTSLNRVNFIISSNDRESPVILDSTSLMGTVIEGKYLDLRRDHLAYTDLVSGDHDIVFSLREEPKFGTLNKLINGNYYAMKISDTFTQEDINTQMIRYVANDEIGNNAQKDFLSFDVSDGSGNVQPNQVLTMKVKPKKRLPPVVKVTSDVKVNEGGEAILESNVISVSDPDSPLSDLIAYIEKQPDYGFLENSRSIPGAEHSLAGIPISSFSYVDLVEGYIKYLQIEHRDVEPERDTLYIRVSDGYLSSPSHLVNITIKPINDEAPVVHTHHLSVLQGRIVKISNSTLSVSDGDTSADQLIITLDNPPQEGEIRLMTSNIYNFKDSKPLLKQDTFTFQDVLNGFIMYMHGVSKSHDNDTFSLSVSDGHHIISASVDVFVIVKDREVPYLVRNLGLEIMPGDSIIIDNKTLNANDSDSAAHLLRYVLISDPSSGDLLIILNGKENKLSSHFKNSGMNAFTQDDIDKEILFYHHNILDPVGLHYFEFNVIDPANNTLLDQKFFISISEDLFPPVIINNTGLSVEEKTSACLNSSILAAVDEHQKDKDLIFSLSSLPFYGFLGMKFEETKPISTFLMSDLKEGRVCYMHKSERFTDMDGFTFTVSDGKNYVHQTFRINITHSYNALPFVKLYPLFIEEGASKIITEFEIDIFDKDSSDSTLTISVISPPNHGAVIHSNGTSINHFSVKDIKQGLISYVHDDSDTVFDSLAVLVTDGLNDEFIFHDKHGKNVTTKNPVVFPIKIYPVDDTSPVLLKNEPLEVLKIDSGKTWNTISENLLYAEDADTEKENIVYRVTLQPHLGSLELASVPDVKIFQFTQKDIENGELQYVMKNDDLISVVDNFMFSVEDTKPNKLFNNIFAIHWSRIHFLSSEYNISETSGLLELTIRRTGNKLLDFMAYCTIENVDSRHRITDSLITVVNEVHFKENDVIKFCIFKVVDNNIFEGMKQFKIVLKSDLSLLASPHTAVITITDNEDEPVISFKEGVFKINETGEFFNFPVIRRGDLEQELSVLCTTSDLTAQGSNASSLQSRSDYRSRDSSHNSLITFDSGVSEVMCSVKIIDDNLYEEEEEFLVSLSNPHPVGKIENFTKAHVVINGPNDAPYIFIQDPKTEMFIGDKNSSVIVVRQGVDISNLCSVWCGSSISLADRSEEEMNTFYQIVFQPFQTTAVCSVKTDSVKHTIKTIQPTMTIFLDSPNGCLMGKPNRITVTLKERIIYPVIEFMENYITVQENVGSVLLPVLRTGDTSSSATLHCFTEDGAAHAREDYEERYRTRRNSRIHFSPGQKESFCPLKIYDDEIHEGSESFLVHLSPLDTESEVVTIGTKKSITVEIVDSEDVTVIELDQSHYLVTQNSSPNSSASVIISVVRHGDVSLLSKVRISTIDGSASSGLDYYAKSKLFSFHPGEKKKPFEIEILYNRRRNWALSFTVILGPDEVINAEIGDKSKAIVTIPRVQSTESLILPSVPIVVSLMHYSDVKNGMNQDAKSGYPLVCITPCDVHYPDYAVTSGLCRESGINMSSLSYSWEIAMPLNSEENMSPFEKITDSTLFTSVYNRVLDSVYFRPHEKVRCVAQPRDSNGHLGIPLRSKPIKISSESGFCLTPSKMQHLTSSISSQPFIATLNYINSSDAYHPNKLNIHVEIPHEDGLLPLLSTYPLHNIDFLLKQNVYRQQHVCSNLLHTTQRSFLKSLQPHPKDLKSAFPYHGEQITKEMQLIYQHLDLKKCKWSFDAWYSMSDLVDLCGGTVVPDFKARDADKTYISVLLPFYVTYIFSSAPTGWISVEHRTEIEFSFFYDTFLWKAGSHADASFNASLSIIRIGTDASGHLFFEFKTVAKFYGCFVLEHNTLPGIKSYVTVPPNLNVKFNLQLLWSEQSFDGPTQYWKATSNYNLKDYSGLYSVHLIPCEVSHTEQFSLHNGFQFLPCIAQTPQKFDLPISFQQTLRPEQVVYALETFFQIFNDENLFLLNPFENYPNFQYTEYKGAFSKGENVYGRVFWSPKQELESAYELKINEVLLCTGKNGFVPLYDPTGKIYGKGPQYGCLILNRNLRHKFILLDRHNPEAINTEFQGLPFEAKFIENSHEYTILSQVPGVDGFVFKTDPLYEVSSSNQWILQVTYSIKPTHAFKRRRSLERTELLPVKEENQTYIRMIFLKSEGASQSLQQSNKPTHQSTFGAHYVLYLISGILIVIGIAIIGYRHPRVAQNTSTKVLDKYTWMRFNTKVCSNTRSNCYKVVECKQKIRQTEKCKIRIYSPKNELPYIDTTSGTEV